MKIFDRSNVLIFSVAMLCVGVVKVIYVQGMDAVSFSELFYKYYILYGQDQIVNLIWLTPILFVVFFVAKEGYIRLVNFNVRYQSRKRYIRNILFTIMVQAILYCLYGLLIQGIFLIYKANVPIILSIDIFLFIIKYITEIFFLIILLVVLSLLLNNFTYAFILLVTLIAVGIMKIKIFIVPFISLYVNSSFNIVSVLLVTVLTVVLYVLYRKKDLSKGENR